MDEIKEQLKWLVVGSVDVEFYFEFIITFNCLILLFFLWMYQLFSVGSLAPLYPHQHVARCGWVGLVHVNKAIFLHQISIFFFCQNEVYNTNPVR